MYYFASDIHLGCGDAAVARRTEECFVRWLDGIRHDAKALFLVGDVFDFWFEYRQVVPKGFVRTLGKLAELTDNGVRVVLFTGNHDMWVTDYLERECGVEIYTSPQEFTLAGKRLYVAHGDNMNIKGQPMLCLMNRIFRSKVLRFLFSWLVHPDLSLMFGKWWSASSRKAHGLERDPKFLRPLVEYAEEYAKGHAVDCFIFGHMHIMAHVERPDIYFMGEWAHEPNCLQMDEAGEIRQIKLD